MDPDHQISTLFLDIGGVLLSDGWGRDSRKEASTVFQLNQDKMEERHHINFETYELGKMTLDEYLNRVVFYQSRDFSRDEFKDFMYQQSQPFSKMIALFTQLKKKHGLKIAVISNEGRELNDYRINTFKLNTFVDFFISSSFVDLRKPDAAIFKLAIDVAQVKPEESIYIDNQPLFVKIGEGFGLKGIAHTDYNSTFKRLGEFGLSVIPSAHG